MTALYSSSVTIGPEFFKKSFNDYSNKFWAFAREILQNSIDCGSTRIAIRVAYHPESDETVVDVTNDGEPMTREILLGKLLSLGSSGKDFKAGTVGGFGKAKEILYFAHLRYLIRTGRLILTGSGAGYDLGDLDDPEPGTRSVVTWDGDVQCNLRSAFRHFFDLCGRKVKATIDGEEVQARPPKMDYVRDLMQDGKPWARAYKTRAFPGMLVARVNGVPMFEESITFRQGVILELEGDSAVTLTANRDHVKYPYRERMSELVTGLAVDRRSAFKLEKAHYEVFRGAKLGRAPDAPAETSSLAEAMVEMVAARMVPPAPQPAGIVVKKEGVIERPPANFIPHEFVVKNCVARPVPPPYNPASLHFDDHCFWLVRGWAGCLIELYELYKLDDKFGVGFVFSEEAEAEYESSSDFGRVYYLNPCIVGRRRYKRRFRKADRHQIAAIAAHEFVHGGLDENYHGEDFANKFTDVMGVVLAHWKRFSRHFN